MLNRKKRSRKRAPERCFCNECNGIYIDPRTYRKHNTTFSLQIDDLMIEASQFFLEDILIIEASQDDPMIEAFKVASPNYFQKSKLISPNIKLPKFCPNCPNWPKLISPI